MSYQSHNPYTNSTIATYSIESFDEIENKIQNSKKNFSKWSMLPILQRCEVIYEIGQKILTKQEELAQIITSEIGKPISESRAEILKCADLCIFYSKNANEFLKDTIIKTDASESKICYQPLGLILGIMPWNYPAWQVLRFSIPALVAGNSVIIKPSPNVPSISLAIQNLFLDSEFKYIFQLIFSDNHTIEKIMPLIDGVAFTGSVNTGKKIGEMAGKNLKKSILELGGNDPFIILPDCDIDYTINMAILSRLLNAGQTCIAAKKFYIPYELLSTFKQKLITKLQNYKIGDPTDSSTQLGTMVHNVAKKNLEHQLENLLADGAELIWKHPFNDDRFFSPVIVQVNTLSTSFTSFQEELFGPIFVLYPYQTIEDVIELEKKSTFGLGASIWTASSLKAKNIANQLDAGAIFINSIVKSDVRMPFGGIKNSGFGKELGEQGCKEFVNTKTIWIK